MIRTSKELFPCTLAVFATAFGGGCGQTQAIRSRHPLARVGATSQTSTQDTDHDDDSHGQTSSDWDNDAAPTWGYPATAADRQAIRSLIGQYYAAAAKDKGQKACLLTDSLIAESVGERYGPSVGLRSSSTCGAVLSELFARREHELSFGGHSFAITVARVKGNRGFAYVRFSDDTRSSIRERDIPVRRQDGVWRIAAVLDNGSP